MSTIDKVVLLFLMILVFPNQNWAQNENTILDYSTSVEIKSNKRITKKTLLIQIDNKESNWIADISIPHNANDKFELLEASIIDLKGNILRKLKKKEITTRSDISEGAFFEDDLISEFKLKWDNYPYQIRYSYEITTDRFLYITHWSPVFITKVSTNFSSLQVKIPQSFKFTIDATEDLTYDVDTLDDYYLYKWKAQNISSFKPEIFSPPSWEMVPSVKIIPKDFTYGIQGSFSSWQSFGNWQNKINEGLDELPQSEKIKINEMTSGIDAPKLLINILYRYMQENTRYIGVMIDEGGLKPFSASYVSEKKYGDCKALTIYMKALLKFVGIPSYYVIIYAGENPVRLKTNLPSQQFNHVILMVPLKNDTLWLENTANYLPPNYLGVFTQNRYALMVNGEQSKLIQTPKLSLEDDLDKTIYKFKINDKGNGSVLISEESHGASFESIKYAQYNLNITDQKDYLEQLIPLSNYEITNWKFVQPKDDLPCIDIDIKLDVKDQLREVGNMLVLKPFTFQIPKLEKPSIRKMPLRINYPVNQKDSLIYNISELKNYRTELPKDVMLESKFGKYTENFSVADSTLIVARVFQLYSGDYKIEDYPDFYNYFDSIKKSQNQSVIILNNTP